MPGATTAEAAPAVTPAELSEGLEALVAWARRLVPPGDLSLTATAVLARLAREGGAGVSALAAAEGVGQPAMSQMLARLERDGLVHRDPSPADGRAVLVRLSDRGRALVAERRAARAAALAELLADAPDGDASLIAQAVPALLRLAAAAPPSR